VLRRSIYKSPAQLRLMIEPGLATGAALTAMRAAVRPGISTLELDAIAEDAIRSRGGEPNFMLEPGYRHTICANVNQHVVHAIPTERGLEPGDIVALDAGAVVGGWHGDAAFSAVLPDPTRPEHTAGIEKLSDVTEQAMWRGIARLATASHLGEVGEAVSAYVRANSDFGVLEDYIGHGIGRSMHEDPPVFNVPGGRDRDLRRGRRLDGHHRRRIDERAVGALGRRAPRRHLGADRRGRRGLRPRAARREAGPDPVATRSGGLPFREERGKPGRMHVARGRIQGYS
jgi:methionyl aminopeptidase